MSQKIFGYGVKIGNDIIAVVRDKGMAEIIASGSEYTLIENMPFPISEEERVKPEYLANFLIDLDHKTNQALSSVNMLEIHNTVFGERYDGCLPSGDSYYERMRELERLNKMKQNLIERLNRASVVVRMVENTFGIPLGETDGIKTIKSNIEQYDHAIDEIEKWKETNYAFVFDFTEKNNE